MCLMFEDKDSADREVQGARGRECTAPTHAPPSTEPATESNRISFMLNQRASRFSCEEPAAKNPLGEKKRGASLRQ